MCDRCEQLEQRVTVLEQRLDSLVDTLHGETGSSLGEALAEEGHEDLASYVAAGTADTGGASPEVREALLELHDDWINIREGRTADYETKTNVRRAAHLFSRFIDKAPRGANETGVVADNGRLKMHRDRAQEAIAADHELPAGGWANTVKRVFRHMVVRTNPYDCQCDWEECSHALFEFASTDTYTISVSEDEWRHYLESVSELVETAATDDGMTAPEDAVDATERMDDLVAAEVADDD
jgi:hypothetical protein